MLTINNLKCKYPDKSSSFSLEMNNISFKPNQVVALVGANGCGKSTFYRAISGMIPTREMSITYDNKIYKSLLDTPLKIGFHNAYAPLVETLTVRQNLKLFARMYNVKCIEDSISSISQKFDIIELLDRYPSTLSQGQQHRAKLARTCAHNPDIVLFDEPTTASDIVQIQAILLAIETICQQGKIVFFSTHHLYEIMELKPRLIGMQNGRIAFDRSWNERLNCQDELKSAMYGIMSQGENCEHV